MYILSLMPSLKCMIEVPEMKEVLRWFDKQIDPYRSIWLASSAVGLVYFVTDRTI